MTRATEPHGNATPSPAASATLAEARANTRAIAGGNASDRSEPNVAAGAAAGFVAGLAATFAMNRAMALWSLLAANYQSRSAGGTEDARDWQERGEGRNANELAAQAIARNTIDRPFTRSELKIAAPLVHYAFGGLTGAVYGAAAEVSPAARALAGTAYGTGVWIVADEVVVPLIGWSKTAGAFSPEMHAQAFVSHLVFGAVTEAVRRTLRRLIS